MSLKTPRSTKSNYNKTTASSFQCTPLSIKLERLTCDSTPDNITTPKRRRKSKELTPLSVRLVQLTDNNSSTRKSKASTPTNTHNMKERSSARRKSTEKGSVKKRQPDHSGTPKAHVEFSLELKKAINERNILTSKTRKRVFDALDEVKTRSEEERRKYKKENALLEIVTSETKYIHQLELIINFFMKPVLEKQLLKPEDFDVLFGNIKTIYNINNELLEELDKGSHNIAKAFSKIAPFLKLYSVYAYDFKQSIQFLQSARQIHPNFAKFLDNQETRPEVQNKLSALLIAPIQRVPRYKLLLSQLLNYTSENEDDYDVLIDCVRKINDAAEHINKIVEDQENMQRLLELQRCLRSGEPNIITPGRQLEKEGVLMKLSPKNGPSEKIYVVLMSDIIMFNKMKKNELKVNSLKCISIFPLNKCKVTEILDKGCFKVTCQDEEIILYHDQLCETKNWIRQIKESIQNHLTDRKTLRKESSSRRPVKRKDLHEYHEVGVSPGRPLKKRKLSTVVDNTDDNRTVTRISKRRPIHQWSTSSSESLSRPLFSAPISEEGDIKTSESTNEESLQPSSSNMVDIYNGEPTNNSFKIGKFFGGVSSTFKKLLGYKK